MIRVGEIYFYLKDDEHGWMSNFWIAPFFAEGRRWLTNEHYYQAHKTDDPALRDWIASAPVPFHAMKAGRNLRKEKGEFRKDWADVCIRVMRDGLFAKFRDPQNTYLKSALLATGNTPLHEDSPTDLFWGCRGADHLGKLLMEVRDELRKEDLDRVGKMYKWDCVTMGERCFGCPYYHVLTEGKEIHPCPRGIRIRYRRLD